VLQVSAMAKASKGSDVTQPSGEKLDFDHDNLRGESNNSLQVLNPVEFKAGL